jgi:hypothetical protein
MREIDLVLLEEIMKRYPVEVNATARRFQIGSMVLVLLALVGLLAHEIATHDPSVAAVAPGTPETIAFMP